MTKLELQQALAARNTELEAARLRIAQLEGDVAMLSRKVAPTPAPALPANASAYRLALRAAREMAMRTGRSVRVA